jgi:hypothetical protein
MFCRGCYTYDIHMFCYMFHCNLFGAVGEMVLYFYETVVCCVCAELIVCSETSILQMLLMYVWYTLYLVPYLLGKVPQYTEGRQLRILWT